MARRFAPLSIFLLATLAGCSGAGSGNSGGGGGGTPPPTPAPIVYVVVNTIALSSVPINQKFYDTLTIYNSGNAPANISSITLTNNTQFSITTNCGSVLAASSSCNGTITFEASTVGAYPTTMSISDNAANSPQTYPFQETAIPPLAPVASLAPATLTFASVTPNTTSTPQIAILTNSGNASLNLSSIAITGPNASSFTLSSSCPSTIGDIYTTTSGCGMYIAMSPTTASSTFNASLVATDDSNGVPGSTQSIALTGTSSAAAPYPQLMFSPSSFDFTNTPLNTTVTRNVTVSNPGNATLNISNIAFNAPYGSPFLNFAGDCGTTLAAGASCTESIGFDSTTIGTFTGYLLFTDNATGSPQTVVMTGSSVAAYATLSSNNISFPITTANTTSPTSSVSLTNNGNLPLTINSITTPANGSTAFAVSNNCGSTLAPGTFCKISASFTPTTAATGYSSSILISTSATPALESVLLTGSSTGFTSKSALYVEPDAAYSWLYSLVNSAATSIDLSNPALSDTTLLSDLTSACSRGVRVRAILSNGSPNATAFSTLNSAGPNCSAAYNNPQFFTQQESAVIVDQQQLAVSTANFTSSTYATARDFAVVDNAPADVGSAEATFNTDYGSTTDFSYVPNQSSSLVWTPDTEGELLNAVSNAQYSVSIETASLTSSSLINALTSACTKGINVTVILNSAANISLLQPLGLACPNSVFVNPKIHGTLILDDFPSLYSVGDTQIGPTSLDDAYIQQSRGLGSYGGDYNTLSNTFNTDLSQSTQY